MAAVCVMLQFATMDRAKYDDVMKALDWKNSGAPKGLISHIAGPMNVGWGVVDVWESQEDFDNFLTTDLTKAFIPRSRHDPKILWVDDAEIVGDRITKVRPIPRNLFTQKTERRIGELGASCVALVVSDVSVHEAP